MQKIDKDSMRKENYMPISHVNTNAKIMNKLLSIQITYAKKICHDQEESLPGI